MADNPPSPGETRPGLLRLLAVEDSAADARLLRLLLAGDGSTRFEVTLATSLTAALREIDRQTFDVVLLDLGLPESHGYETFARFQEVARTVPTIVLSGLEDEELALRTVHEGAQDYLTKGTFDRQLLVRTVHYAIERAKLRSTLRLERQLLRSLIDSLPERIFVKDPRGRYLTANRAMIEFAGLGKEAELVGRTDFDLFDPNDAMRFQAEDDQVLLNGEPLANQESQLLNPDGTATWLLTTKVPLRDAAGEVVGTAGIQRDITRRKEDENRLRELATDLANSQQELLAKNTDLQQSNQKLKEMQLQLIQVEKLEVIGRLAAGVAHEVKNPLATLQMGVNYLSDDLSDDDPNLPKLLKQMQDAIHRATKIIAEMVDFSSARPIDRQPTPINDLVNNAITLIRPQLAPNNARIAFAQGENLPRVMVDRIKIEQVIINALQNAIHAMADGGQITVTTRTEMLSGSVREAGERVADTLHPNDRVVVVQIEDEGSGIAVENQSRLFDPFFTTKPTGTGTGLGLSVARKIVGLHGGRITLTNRPEGGGARFTLILKAEDGESSDVGEAGESGVSQPQAAPTTKEN